MRNSSMIQAVLGLCLMAGCSGGSALDFNAATGQLNLRGVQSDGTAITPTTGTFTLDSNAINIGVLAGTTDAARRNVALTAGSTATLAPEGMRYLRSFTADPIGSPRQTGIIGVAATNLPLGTGDYTGTAAVTVRDGTTLYDLNGTANVAANFADGTVTTTFDALSGTQAPAFAAPSSAQDVGRLTVTGAAISGTVYSGGTATLDSTVLHGGRALGAQTTTDLQAGFYGPRAVETGGMFNVTDPEGSNFVMQGTFIAK